ncbi:MAG: hypothetical protein LJE60_12690 [Thiocapsa sp.]|jgi:hypothetical protein|nr:hypothetical protein [Thiocapsa sp.]MCG6897946.1 hypothetical protein [Thiocapsa sp.]
MRRESEELRVPAGVTGASSLLTWLGSRKRGAAVLFEPDRVQVTVNSQYFE